MEQIIFNETNFHRLCDRLAKEDAELQHIIHEYGYPPLWNRRPTFETLIHIILEQQVSLSSAKAALDKLKTKIGRVTPQKMLLLTDEEMKSCYFSRQKMNYARCLAREVTSGKLRISKLSLQTNEDIRATLTQVKGIGHWTVDVFLMMCLNRSDLFPAGDIALVNSVKHIKRLPHHTTKEDILLMADHWKPYRTVAAYLFWHAYIKRKNIKF